MCKRARASNGSACTKEDSHHNSGNSTPTELVPMRRCRNPCATPTPRRGSRTIRQPAVMGQVIFRRPWRVRFAGPCPTRTHHILRLRLMTCLGPRLLRKSGPASKELSGKETNTLVRSAREKRATEVKSCWVRKATRTTSVAPVWPLCEQLRGLERMEHASPAAWLRARDGASCTTLNASGDPQLNADAEQR